MDITVSTAEGRVPVTILRLKGRINLGNAGDLEKAARQAIEAGARDMLLDLTEVESLTSAGLRALLYPYQMLARQAGAVQDQTAKSPHFKLLNPTPHVRKVLGTAGFETFLDIHDDLDTAIASF